MKSKYKVFNQTTVPNQPAQEKKQILSKKRAASFCQESAIFTSPADIRRIKDKIKNEGIPSERIISRDTVINSNILTITQIKGNILPDEQKELYINASGLIDKHKLKVKSNRDDGVVYFWTNTQKVLGPKDKKDIVLYINLEMFLSKFFFAIYYALDISDYRLQFNIKDKENIDELSNKVQLQIPYAYPLVITKKNIIQLGKSKFQIVLIVNCILEITNLKTNQKYIYNPLAISEVTIGRDGNCTIHIDDDRDMSLIHATFIYEQKNKHWTIRDGSKIKESKTGTWIIGYDSYVLKEKMKLKINDALLEIRTKA